MNRNLFLFHMAIMTMIVLAFAVTCYALLPMNTQVSWENGDPNYNQFLDNRTINDEPTYAVALNYSTNHDALVNIGVNSNTTDLSYWNGSAYVNYTEPIPVAAGNGTIWFLLAVHGEGPVYIHASLTRF